MTHETGPFCATCRTHRVQIPGTRCPVCLDNQRQESQR